MSTTIESLELEIQSNSKSAVSGIDALTQSLTKLKSATKGGLGLSSVSKELGKVSSATSKVTSENHRASRSFTDFYHVLKTGAGIISRAGRTIKSLIDKSSEYNEVVNLFSVSLGEYANEAFDYANKVSDVMGIDTAEWMKSQGVFMTLATGFGVAGDRAYKMSQQLPQLGYDISSFQDISVEEAMQKLQSGLAGELEPLRRIGYDLSQAKLEATAFSLGIDKTVSSMTQAEKAQLRYYAIMTQVTQQQGDMARTLHEPANQMRVFKAQVDMAARSLGNIFIPALNAILPVAIAVVQVIRSLADTIAGLFGYEFPEVDYSGVSAMSGAAEGTSDAMDDATKSAKKLKSYMLGFDELNVINPDTSGSSSPVSDLSDGFDFDLPEYDFLKGAANSKVTEIVEKMKEWLGITEKISSWGELFDTRLGKILIAVGAVGAALVAWKIGKGVTSAFTAIGSLFGMKGLSIGGGASKGSFSPKNVLKGLASITIIIGGVTALVTAMGLLMKIPGYEETIEEGLSSLGDLFNGLLPILLPITLVSVEMVLLGKVQVSQVAKGLANTAIIIGGTTAVITAIGALMTIPYFSDFLSTGITAVQDAFNGLYEIAIPIGVLSAYMVLIGMASPATMAGGLAGYAMVIGGTVPLITAIGALMSLPEFSNFLSTGIKSVQDVFNGLYDIAIPIGVLSAYMVVLGFMSPATMAEGLAGFAIVIGGTTALITAIGALMSLPGFSDFLSTGITSLKDMFDGLYDIAVPIGVLSAYIATLGFISPATMVGGFAGFATVIGGTVALLTAIGALMSMSEMKDFLSTGITSLKDMFDGLYDIAVPIGVLSAYLIVLGWVSPATVLSGLAGFALVVGGFAAVLVALGALRNIDGFDWIVDQGADLLVKLGDTLGKFAGSIVGGFAEGVTDSFPKIGENLAGFMEGAEPFFDGLEKVNAASITAVKNLAAMVLVLTAADILDGLTSWFTGGTSLVKFGEELEAFAPHFKAYADEVKDIDASAVEASSVAAKSIIEFANNVPNEGGLAAWFAGENNIDTFGEKLPSFGKNIKAYADSVKGLDADVVANSTKAAKSVIEIAKNIPNSGGVAAWFTGDNDIEVFGDKLPAFGKNIKKYASSVAGLDKDVVDNSTAAAQSIVALCKNIPNSGGVASWFSGDNDISDFGTMLAAFGVKFKEYYESIKSMSKTTLNNITSCIDNIIDFALRIKDDVDTKKIDKFTTAIEDLGKAIKNLPSSKTITITVKQVNNSTEVDSVWDAIGNLPLFASGGFPEQGQMFVAREAGAEMVGTIGRRTAVANNDQIVAGIAGGVAEANEEQNALLREQNSLLRSILEKDSGVYLDGKNLTSSIEKYQRERGRVLITGGVV